MNGEVAAKKAELEEKLGIQVHHFSVGDYNFLFRPLTIKELSLADSGSFNYADLEDLYVKAVTLYPEDLDLDSILAGYVTQYVDYLLNVSGFESLEVINQMLEKHREIAEKDIIHTMQAYIITAMPTYKPHELDELSMEQFTKLVVMAEDIIKVQQAASGLQPTDFKLVISPIGAEPEHEEMPRPQRRQPNPFTDTPMPGFVDPPEFNKRHEDGVNRMTGPEDEPMRRKIIRQIMEQNAAVIDPLTYSGPQLADPQELEKLSLDQLKTMAGVTKSNDPIAARLAQKNREVLELAKAVGRGQRV